MKCRVFLRVGGYPSRMTELRRRSIVWGRGSRSLEDDQKGVLLQRRKGGLWGVRRGFMELRELDEETARREVEEETGIVLGQLSLLTVRSEKDTLRKLLNLTSLTVACWATEFDGISKLEGVECTEVGFFGSREC